MDNIATFIGYMVIGGFFIACVLAGMLILFAVVYGAVIERMFGSD